MQNLTEITIACGVMAKKTTVQYGGRSSS